MQPLQYYLRDPAAKDNSITHAAAARSNLDAATTMRSAETELQNTIEIRATASEIAAPQPDGSRRQSMKKTILKHFLKGFLKGTLLAPKLRKSADKSLSQPGCSHSNTIYDVQLQKTIVLRMQPQHRATLTQPLQCDLQRLSCKTQKKCAQQLRKLQLFQCDLQPQIQETHRTTHTGTTTRCRVAETQRRNRFNSKRSKPHPPHTRGTFHRRLKPLYTELKDRITPQVNFFQ